MSLLSNDDLERAKRALHASLEDFEKKLSNFLKDSEDKLTSIKRQTESRRGGKGSRR